MKHFILKSINALFSLSFLTPLTLFSLSACHKQEINIESIELYSSVDTIRPGESVIVRAVIQPTMERTQNLKWSLDVQIPGLQISNDGVLSVSISCKIDAPFIVQVKGTSPYNDEIFKTTDISVLPKSTYDFQGFLNNEIQYFDRSHELQTMKLIVKPGTYEYTLPHPIDVFEFDDLPIGSTSWFNFVPLIAGGSLPYMRFQLFNSSQRPHVIQWEDYVDGRWTTKIPSFLTHNCTGLQDAILVTFACDPRVKLTIPLNAWLSRIQGATGEFAYFPVFSQDKHTIELIGTAQYKVHLFCPAMAKEGVYQSTLDTIYCFRPKFQYTDYYFRIDMEPNLDPEIANIFSISPQPETVFTFDINVRKVDNFRYYKFNIDYQFDLSKRIHTADYFHFDDIKLCQLNVYDTLSTPEKEMLSCYLEIWLDWI